MLAVATAWLAAVACSEFGANDGAVLPDASPSADVALGDAPSTEAAGDAGDAGPWCASQAAGARFCADFDNQDPIGFGFTELIAEQGGQVVRDDSLSVSAPSSALAQIPDDAGGCAYAELLETFPTAGAIHLGFSIRMGDITTTLPEEEIVTRLEFSGTDGGAPCFVQLSEHPSGASLLASTVGADAGTVLDQGLTRYATPGVWARYQIDIVPAPEGPTISAQLDGKEAFAATPLPKCAMGGTTSARVGLYCQHGPAKELRLDNIVFDDK